MLGFPEKVLVIDDDALVRDVLVSALMSVAGVKVKACGSSNEALDLAPTFAPELILLDLKMPVKDGTAFLAEFQSKCEAHDVPIIFVTGAGDVEMKDEYKALGVIGVIHKPFKPKELIHHIRRIWSEKPGKVTREP